MIDDMKLFEFRLMAAEAVAQANMLRTNATGYKESKAIMEKAIDDVYQLTSGSDLEGK